MKFRLVAVAILFLVPNAALGSDEDRVANLCKEKIGDLYGVDRFRHVWAEKTGHHRWHVQGKVKSHDRSYPFDCKIKEGQIRSYSYNGPSSRHNREHDNNNDAAIAVGAGIAIVAAIAAAHKDQNSEHHSSRIQVSETILEDNCHEELKYRIRDEHNYTARVSIESARVKGHDLTGNAKVVYEGHHPHHASYTCHFDKNGHVLDTDYQLF